MAQEVRISIVIPVYNVAPYIEMCIRSVMAQTWHGNLECILVDDCGTDDSMVIAEKMLSTYSGPVNFQIVRHKMNRGLSAARNTGMDNATGDYVFFLDSDDEILPDCIDRLAKPLSQRNYDFVIGNYRLVGAHVKMNPLRLKDGVALFGDEILHAYRIKDWYMMAYNKLYRVSFLNYHGLRFYEGIIYEDELWSFQIACLAESVYAVGHETYLYKIRESSITGRKNYERSCRCIMINLYEMIKFSHLYNLHKKHDVHNLIQNFRIITLNSIYSEAKPLFYNFYLEQRLKLGVSWWNCFIMDGLDIRKQLRDFHLALPVFWAIPYLKLLFRFL